MADNILRLKVESSEYDAKLKKAAEGIRHLADVAHKGGGDLTGLEKAELDYIKALGNMETKSRTASGQLRELSGTYKELKVVYDQLNEVEKADEGGKALAASLETLKQRAQEAKAQLDSASQSLQSNGEAGKGTSSVMEMLKDKFTVNIDAIKLFNIGLQAAEGALSVAKDAFFASEATVDEWGRVVDSSKSLYEGFLTALNTGDISGYLGRIDEIVTAARRAYDELDRLGTMKTIQAPKMSAQQTENERMRMMIQTGRYIAPVDGRRASMQNGQLLTPEQIRRIEAQLQNGMKNVVALVGNEVKQTGKAIDAVYDRQAKELGLSLKEFRKGTSSMAEFDKRMAGYDQYQKWREQHTTIDMQSGREIVARGNPFEQFAKWGTFRVDGQRYNDLVRLIQQRDQQAGQAYSMQSQAYRTMNRAEGITVSKLMRGETAGGSSGGGGGTTPRTTTTRTKGGTEPYTGPIVLEVPEGTTESMKQLSEQLRYFNELRQNATTTGDYLAATEGIEHTKLQMGVQGDALAMGVSTDAMLAMQEGLKESMAESFASVFEGFQINEKDVEGMKEGNPMEEMKKGMEKLSTVMSGLSSITSGLSAVGIKLDGQFGQFLKGVQGVISIVQGVMAIIQAVSTPAEVTNTVATNLNTTALGILTDAVAANSIIHAIPGLANGGVVGHAAGGLIVPGNFPSGDQIPIAVNSGEVILNKAQAGNLLAQMQDADNNGNGNAQPYVDGELIFLGINNYLRRSGMGELVTSNI